MEILTEITYEENEKIRILIEKRDALRNLLMLLRQEKQDYKLLRNIQMEYELICKEYDAWWSEMIDKAGVQQYKEERLFV